MACLLSRGTSTSSGQRCLRFHRPMDVERKPPNMLAFVIVAAIVHRRRAVLKTCRTSDDVMAVFSMTRKLDLWALLKGASRLIPARRRRA